MQKRETRRWRVSLFRVTAAGGAVLDLAEQSHQAAGNAELKTMIEQARPLIETHLKQAQEIEKKLGGTA